VLLDSARTRNLTINLVLFGTFVRLHSMVKIKWVEQRSLKQDEDGYKASRKAW
jgi:hypothetical protein